MLLKNISVSVINRNINYFIMTKILIADDSLAIQNILKTLLESNGFTVVPVTKSPLILQSAKENSVDAIILDLMMPEVPGEEIYKQLKADQMTKNIPVLILTAKKDALTWNEELKTCDMFMTKPFENNEVLEFVKKLSGGSTESPQNNSQQAAPSMPQEQTTPTNTTQTNNL